MNTSTLSIGVIMDPIENIKIGKDSTFAMLLAAQRRGWQPMYMNVGDLRVENGRAAAAMREIEVRDDPEQWFTLGDQRDRPLDELDIVLMRKDPPFDMEYIYATYILDLAASAGVLVSNPPGALRDLNEKAACTWFPSLCPPTLISRSMKQMRAFLDTHKRIVVKPLDGMGGRSIFVIDQGDLNANVVFETLTGYGRRFAMAQKHIAAITDGDKRVLLVDGEAVPYALARIPAPGENRGNLAAGARAESRPLTARDREIATAVAPMLRERGIGFAGLDVIGDFMTEINVTSPTCIRELDRDHGLDIAGDYMAALARQR